jgi:hypothetical protein
MYSIFLDVLQDFIISIGLFVFAFGLTNHIVFFRLGKGFLGDDPIEDEDAADDSDGYDCI